MLPITIALHELTIFFYDFHLPHNMQVSKFFKFFRSINFTLNTDHLRISLSMANEIVFLLKHPISYYITFPI